MLQPMIFHMTFGLETTLGAYFALDSNAYFIDKTGFILISENAEYLQKHYPLNSLSMHIKNILKY